MKIENTILEVLSRAETNDNSLKLIGQLDRAMYMKVNKVLEACGGKWNKKLKCHMFDSDASERIDQIILSGEVEIPKDEFNYFPTPKKIVEQLISLAEIEDNMRVLEPSAGQGAIVVPLLNYTVKIDCYEFNKANFDILANAMSNLRHIYEVTCEQNDFTTVTPVDVYDRVIMNPPFLKQSDIKHVTHAYKFVKSGGKLISVMSSSVMFRDNKLTKDFRELVESNGGYFIELPSGSFKESGTMVNTVIVVIPKQ